MLKAPENYTRNPREPQKSFPTFFFLPLLPVFHVSWNTQNTCECKRNEPKIRRLPTDLPTPTSTYPVPLNHTHTSKGGIPNIYYQYRQESSPALTEHVYATAQRMYAGRSNTTKKNLGPVII